MYFLDKAGRTRMISSEDAVGTGTQVSSFLVIDFIEQISIYSYVAVTWASVRY